ncbi:MAG: metallophosphoesterase [Clostridia bacterium]|nr:metallophosphoesterase [Clostridia bacterium]
MKTKTKNRFLSRVPVLAVLLLLAVAGTGVYRGIRAMWVFYDQNIPLVGATGLFLVMLANIALLTALLGLRLWQVKRGDKPFYETKAFLALAIVGCVMTVLTVLFACAIFYINGHETNQVLFEYLKRDYPLTLLFLAAVFVLMVLPRFPKRAKIIVSVVLAVVLAGGLLWTQFPVKGYRIVSDPVVFDTGSGYSVVFATDDVGTGYVRYTYNGTEYTVKQQIEGRLVGDRLIHAVAVPYEHLNGNTYTVGSTRVIEEFSYGSRLGKTVESDPYTLKAPSGDMQSWLTVSDWHSYLDSAYTAVSYIGDYDGVLLMGDPASGMDFETQAVENIVKFAGTLTKGEKPAVYVRGNHDTRGAFADALPGYLGYDTLYAVVKSGEYSFVALSSGEDKNDDHVEYGGMDDYKAFRARQLDWLKTVDTAGDRVIVLTHAWQVAEPEAEKDVSKAYWDEFDRLGARLVVCGHTHRCRILGYAGDEITNETEKAYHEAYPDIVTYMDGGHKGEAYIASKLVLSPEGFRIIAVDWKGEQLLDENFTW